MKPKKTRNKPQAIPEPKEAVITIPAVDVFEKYGAKIAMGIILLIAFICFKDFILQQKIYLFKDIGSDSLNASWPWMAHSSDYIAQYGIPSWSFSMGMGQNILSFSFYDPFDYILYFFGKDNMTHLIVYKELTKILLAGFLFFKYLKLLKLSNYTATIGAMMYAFCGYMVLGSGWFLFSFEVFNAALLLLCFELLYQKNRWYWFALPIFLIGISRPFNLWMYAIFLGLYIIFRIFQEEGKIDYKKAGILFGKIIGVSIIGLGLSAPIFLEHIQVILDSPRGSGPDSYSATLSSAPMFRTPDKIEFGSAMMRFFSNDILGSGVKFKGWLAPAGFLESPAFYCGLPCLLLFTQFFQFLSKQVKRVAIILLMIWLLPIVFPYFRQAFWLFSGDYYRTYSFFVALILIYYSANAFDKLLAQSKINLPALILTGVVLFVFLNYPYFKGKEVVDGGIRLFTELSLVIYAFLLYFMVKKKENLNYKYAFIAWLFIELTFFSWCTVNRRDTVNVKDLTAKIGYNDYSVEAISYLKKSDPSFYRIDKNYFSSPAMHGSLNDGLAQNYYGTSSYNPFNQKYYIDYLKTMGIINKVNELESRWSPGLINRFILESLNDVKYILTKTGYAQPSWRVSHDSIAKFGDVLVLKNKFCLPLAYGFGKYMKLSDFDKLAPAQKDYVSTKACVVNDEDIAKVSSLREFDLKDTIAVSQFTFDRLKENIDSLKKNTINITDFKPVNIKGGINLPSAQMLYVSIPFDKGWSVKDNGAPIQKFILSNGMTGLFLAKGAHSLEFTYASLNFKKGLLISVVTLLLFAIIIYVYFRQQRTRITHDS